MTKIDIVDKMYERVGFPKSEVAKIVEKVFDTIKKTLQREDKLVISGFGNFVIRNKKPGVVVIPRRELLLRSPQEEY